MRSLHAQMRPGSALGHWHAQLRSTGCQLLPSCSTPGLQLSSEQSELTDQDSQRLGSGSYR